MDTKISFCIFLLCKWSLVSITNGQEFGLSNNGVSVTIGGAFTSKTSAAAEGARIAIQDITELISRNRGYKYLNISLVEEQETGCDPHTTTRLINKLMLSESPNKPILISGCQEDCILMSKVAPVFNAVTICYGMTRQSTQDSFSPGQYSTYPQLSSTIKALIKFIQKFGWKRVAVISQDWERESFYFDLAHHFSESVERAGIAAARIDDSFIEPSFVGQPYQSHNIFFVFGGESSSRDILCQIYMKKMFDPQKYVWVFVGVSRTEWFLSGESGREDFHNDLDPDHIYHQNCKPEQLIQAADGHFTAKPVFWNPSKFIPTVSGKNTNDFRRKLEQKLRQSGEHIRDDFEEGPLSYDAVWAAYLVLNKTIVECYQDQSIPCDFTYLNHQFGEKLQDNLDRLWFQGVSGEVAFNEGRRSETLSHVEIDQYKNRKWNSILRNFNKHYNTTWINQNPFGNKVPADTTSRDPSLIGLDPGFEVFPYPPVDGKGKEKCNSANRSGLSLISFFLWHFASLFISQMPLNP